MPLPGLATWGEYPSAQFVSHEACTAKGLPHQLIRPAESFSKSVHVCRSVLEQTGRSDWKDLLTGKDGKDDRSGLGIYGTTKLFNIMLAKEYSRRLQARISPPHPPPPPTICEATTAIIVLVWLLLAVCPAIIINIHTHHSCSSMSQTRPGDTQHAASIQHLLPDRYNISRQ